MLQILMHEIVLHNIFFFIKSVLIFVEFISISFIVWSNCRTMLAFLKIIATFLDLIIQQKEECV